MPESISSQFGIPLPHVTAVLNAANGTPVASSCISLIAPLDSYSDVHLGHVRRLKNISCTMYVQVNYTVSTAGTPGAAVSCHALATFTLYRNQQQVFTSSAQIELPPTVSVSQAFACVTEYGIYSDFVNPIELNNSDQLSVQVEAFGYEEALEVATSTGPNPWFSSAVNVQLLPGGIMYYSEEEQ